MTPMKSYGNIYQIETILDVHIEIVKGIYKQHPIEINPEGKGVRLDIRMQGDDTIYGLEMQNGHKKALPRRGRYYQAMTDIDMLERGARYDELKESVQIFICTFDPFGLGLEKYTIKKTIDEAPGYEYNDGTRLVFLSSTANSENEENSKLKAFLDYLENGEATTELTRRIDEAVCRAREQKDWRKEYMLLEEKFHEYKEEGRAEGREEGREERECELIRKMREKGMSDDEISALTDIPLQVISDMITSG